MVPQQNDGREVGASASNFIRNIIVSDVEAGRMRIVLMRLPPDPNGYLLLDDWRNRRLWLVARSRGD